MSESKKNAISGGLVAGKAEVGAAIGRIPSGCSILTAAHAGQATGVLVSWVQQAAFEPPSITVAIRRGRPVAGLIDASGRFLLNLIGDDPTAMFRHFGRGFTLDEDAFAGLETEPTEFGVLLRKSVACLGCHVGNKVPVGDHDLYVAMVAAARVTTATRPYVHIRNNGLAY